MKVLLVTGTLAEETVEQYAKQATSIEASVFVINVAVAAFLTPKTISANLNKTPLQGFDAILVPGLVRGDTAVVSEAVGIPTFKGPRYAADLPTVLDSLGDATLSTTTPACDLLKETIRQKALLELAKVEKNRTALLKKPHNMLIKNLPVGKDFPMRVLAEVVDAALLPNDKIQRLAKQYVQDGADIIDLGMVAGESRPADAKRIVETVKETVSVPISIDTIDSSEIQAAVSAGADIILSVDAGNIEEVASIAKDATVVAIPTNQSKGFFPKQAVKRVEFLEQIVIKAKDLGVTKILGDLILDPSHILESFIAYRQFAERNPNVPLFVGVSNVTELMDSDSIGVNALLARLSSEIKASVMLATEKSDKAKGTVKEEVAAAKMMFLAEKRDSVPKDLGIDLLVLKDKRNREEIYSKNLEANVPITEATEDSSRILLDKKGTFRILLDRQLEAIVALHYSSLDPGKPDVIFKGKTSEAIYKQIACSGMISRFDHAAYVGSELTKAEIALKIGKEYLQDKPLF